MNLILMNQIILNIAVGMSSNSKNNGFFRLDFDGTFPFVVFEIIGLDVVPGTAKS